MTRDLTVAYVKFPDLTVSAVGQRYTCTSRDSGQARYQCESGRFQASPHVDEHGLVLDYPGIWRRIPLQASQPCRPTPAPGPGEADRGIGTSLRSYDPGTRRWQVIWLGAVSGITVILRGGTAGEQIRLEGPDPDGTMNQWMFTDITASSFTWTGLESTDQGTTWHLRQRMTGTRRHA